MSLGQPQARRAPRLLLAAAAMLWACGETTIAITDPMRIEPDGGPTIDLQLGLLAHLPLDEAEAGAQALDVSGNGHHGTPSVSPPTPSTAVAPTGFVNPRSLEFSGTEQFLGLGNPPGLDISGTITLCAWVRVRSTDGFRNIVAHGWHHMPNEEIALRVQDNIELVVQPAPLYGFVAWDGADHAAVAVIPEGDIGAWHHLCGTFDGETYRLYRDGQLVSEDADPVAPMRVQEAWAIGARGMPNPLMPETFDPRYFDGLIDEVRIYGRALSDAEVLALFSQ
jgi:hypothetical protein